MLTTSRSVDTVLAALTAALLGCGEPDVGRVGDDGSDTGDADGSDVPVPDGGDGDGDEDRGTSGEVPGGDDGGTDGTAPEEGGGTAGETGDPKPAALIPDGFGIVVDDRGNPASASDGWTLLDGWMGASAVDPGGLVTGLEHRMRVRLPAIGFGTDAVTLTADVTNGFGEPLANAHDLPLRVRVFDGATLSPSDEVAAATVAAVVVSGRLWAELPTDIALAMAEGDVRWLTFALDGDALAPAVRVGAVPTAVTAESFAAGGVRVEDGVRLPATARERTVLVRSSIYQPGDLVGGLPDPAHWTCHHRATALGYPRTTGARTLKPRCQGAGPDIEVWAGTATVAVATVGEALFPTVLEDDGWPFNVYAPCEDDGSGGCAPRVAVHLFEQTLDHACSPYQVRDEPMETSVWDYGPVLDEPGDPGASELSVHVVTTCTYDLTWPSGFDGIDP